STSIFVLEYKTKTDAAKARNVLFCVFIRFYIVYHNLISSALSLSSVLTLCNHNAAALKMKSDHCAQGWKFFSGKCYYFSTDEETWNASRNACVDKGGYLVIVTSPMEQDFLKRSKPGSGSEFYWIGLTDAVVEGEWHWLDGTKLSQTPRYWTGNEPDDWKGDQNAHPEGEDCAVMELSSDSYLLLDAFCNEESKKLKHVCEAKAGM
uniref:C-type lectin domain-containing protein n=1 Tax=Electrophorus electricus TaxID=8005 RepID=A0A4W4E1A7_ELEEL